MAQVDFFNYSPVPTHIMGPFYQVLPRGFFYMVTNAFQQQTPSVASWVCMRIRACLRLLRGFWLRSRIRWALKEVGSISKSTLSLVNELE
ncbi:hypothetical protein BpHYR1_006360 [Brachionus plicatilis]|uniref:Uncharacterized protein n=1 Tax=Brachionus plicatilis TaxID=10195 RepID=A0A3M7SA30_BRAPC|nr:hypothetical protein BpHYR1_006360 [Brachionus plicatilis]